MDEGIDWPGLMRAGLGVLRLPPEAFWAMSPVELYYALQGAGALPMGQGMNRQGLEALMAAYPDGHGPGQSQVTKDITDD